MPEDISSITSTTRACVLTLDPDASYLLTGGLGGLGKSVASWMVECGARSLIFLSRSAGLSDESKAFFNELESLGCSVSAVAGKVQDMENVSKAISKASRPMPASVLNICPIDGVGFVSENPIARKNLKAQGLYFLGEQDFLDYMKISILNSNPPPPDPKISTLPSASWKNTSQIVMGLRSEIHLDDPHNHTN